MNQTAKLLSLLLAAVMLFSLAACSSSGKLNAAAPGSADSSGPSASGVPAGTDAAAANPETQPAASVPVVPAPTRSPVDGTEPAVPVYTERPVEETEPAVPVDTERPVEETEPAVPVYTERPVEETEPAVPVYTERPVEETEPAVPVYTERPVEETEPIDPAPTDVPAETSTLDTVHLCIGSEPETLDPTLSSSIDSCTYILHQFENLMKYELSDALAADDPNMKAAQVVFGQAESYAVSEDQRVYTFLLRDDIYWSDGRPVEAQDWVYSWQRLVDPATAADYGYFLDGIVLNAAAIQAGEMDKSALGIRALDDKTLEITLEAPCTYFPEICAFAPLAPLRQDVVEGSGSWTDPANLVVNGPYRITEWVHDDRIVMEQNEKYYDLASLGPRQIVWQLSDNETAILSYYKDGDYQFIKSFPTDTVQSLRDSGDCFFNPYVGTYYLYLNCDRIPDWRVRAAMVLSVDRDYIVDSISGQTPATGFVASGIQDSTGADFSRGASALGAICGTLQELYPDYDLSDYDGRCQLAIDLYNQAVNEGKWDPDAAIVFLFNTSYAHRAIADACSSDWKVVLGMNVSLENQDWSAYIRGLSEHSFDAARFGWIADYNDPTTYLELLVTGNTYNYSLYSDPDYDGRIAAAKAMTAGPARDATLYEAEETLFGEGGFPVCPIYYYSNMYCMNGLKNVGYTPMGYFFFMYAQEG